MRKRSSRRKYFYLFIAVVVFVALYLVAPYLEWHPPRVELDVKSGYVGARPVTIRLSDEGRGLRRVEVQFRDVHGVTTLALKDYDPPAPSDTIVLELDYKSLGMKEGEGELRVKAEDASRLRLFFGNRTVVAKQVKVDFVPPTVSSLLSGLYVARGGTAVAVYTASPDTELSGVKVGDRFFRGTKGYFKKPDIYLVLFTYPYDQEGPVEARLVAVDKAGNSAIGDLPYVFKERRYKKSTINVPESFIRRKVLPLYGERNDAESDADVFVAVNRRLRKKNELQIGEITSRITPRFLWQGPFKQLSNSKVEAGFADYRTYLVDGEVVDSEYHLGYDLAVVPHYRVEAANDGIVAFAGDLGIYGKSVIIDHGFGLFTLYSHMSFIGVDEGQEVRKGQIIGRTGQTGLAGGDHLHYGMYVQGVAVDPIEWWDPKWLENSIVEPIKTIEREYGVSEGHRSFVSRYSFYSSRGILEDGIKACVR